MHGLLNFILAAILAPVVLVVVGVPMLIFAGFSVPYGLVVNYGIMRRERRLLDPLHPFVAWCRSRYTSPSRGAAFITEPDRSSFPRGFIRPEYLKGLFPEARVVTSVLVSKGE